MGRLVDLKQTGVDRGGQPVLRGVSLLLEPGQSVGVAGPNGSGKTSLLRLMATLLPPSAGTGHVLGATLGSADVHSVRSEIGMISHIPAVISQLTHRENLEHVARLSGADATRIGQVLRIVGLDEVSDRRAETSSFGMLRRIEVARLLLTQPRLLLLDEPFSGLDTQAQELIGALVKKTLSIGGGAVLVSHDAERLSSTADAVLVLDGGRLTERT